MAAHHETVITTPQNPTKRRFWDFATLGVVLLAVLLAANPGKAQAPPVSGIFVVDNHRMIKIDDMIGAGWIELRTMEGPAETEGTRRSGIFIDNAGRIYFAGNRNHRIVRMDDMTGAGQIAFGAEAPLNCQSIGTVLGPCTIVTGVGLLRFPGSVFVDAAGRIYVTDATSRIVRIDDMTGAGWTTFDIGGGDTWPPRAGGGAIVVDTGGRIYVADSFGNRIVGINDMTGAGWVSFGSAGDGVGQFGLPVAVSVDGRGRIYLAEFDNNRITRIDDMTGAGWTTLGSEGSGVNQFDAPAGIFVDAAGRIYVSDSGNGRIVRMDDMTGAGWTSFGTRGIEPGQFNHPSGIFVRLP